MQRLICFAAALALSSVAVTSACTAGSTAPAATLRFTLEPEADGRIEARFRKADGASEHFWSTELPAAEFAGLNVGAIAAPGSTPVRFAIVREAGRLDCSGTGGNRVATGSCGFTPDAGFIRALDRAGVRQPSEEQQWAMMAVNVRRALIDALAASRYPVATPDQLIGLAAVGVDGSYIRGMSAAGYRPETLDTLLQFKALNITPAFIERFVALGYGKLPASELVQLKALDISPDYIAGFERIGYGRLPASQLVQLKALGVTPDYVRSFQAIGYERLRVSALIQMKALNVTPEFARSVRRDGEELPSPDQLVQMRALGEHWSRR